MAIYPSDNCLVLSWTSYCNFLLHGKPAPMNNLLQLATQCSSEFFINSSGFYKFNNKPGAKNLIALKVSGISVLIAVGIMIWPCRAKFSWTKILHRCEAKTMYWCPNKERSFTFLVFKGIVLVFVWFCENFISYRYLKYFYCAKKFAEWAFIACMAVLGCVLYGSTTSKHLWCEYPTKIIVIALEEICTGNAAGLFVERTATTSSLQSPDWLADLYHWGLSQAFSLLRLAQLSLTAFIRELQYELGMCASYGSPTINNSSQI